MADQSTVLAVTPEGVGAPIETLDDAIAEDVRLAAVIDVATDRRQALKAWAHRELGRPGASVEVEGVGKALVTDPTSKPKITDDDAFRAWALKSYPDRTGTRQVVNGSAIERALAGDHGDDLAGRLAEILDEIPDAVTTDVVLDGKLVDDLAKPKISRELEDGRLVVKETGEIIPGLELRLGSQPSPRITPDKDLLARIVGEISARLTPVPSIEEEASDA